MLHLPKAHYDEDAGLSERPVQNSFVGAFAGLTETLFTVALVVLFLGDLLYLIQQLTDSQLEFCEFFFLGDVGVVDGVLADLNIEMDTEL
jgi:hypothetical protein